MVKLIVSFVILQVIFSGSLKAATAKKGSLACPVVIKPGERLGPIKIGMSLNDLKKEGFAVKPDLRMDHWSIVGPFNVYTPTDEKVEIIESNLGELPQCVQVNNKKIPKVMKFEKLASLHNDCWQPDAAESGKMIVCRGLEFDQDAHPPFPIKVRVTTKD